MGHAIGYIREKNSNPSNFGNSMMSSRSVVGINDTKSEKHEYHSISDNEDDDFFKPLDLGPSLMDEVFGELGSPNRLVTFIYSTVSKNAKICKRVQKDIYFFFWSCL